MQKTDTSTVHKPTSSTGCHLDMHGVWVTVSSGKSAEDSRVRLLPVFVTNLCRAALQCEFAVSRLYKCVLAQAVEGVLEAVQRADVWVTV